MHNRSSSCPLESAPTPRRCPQEGGWPRKPCHRLIRVTDLEFPLKQPERGGDEYNRRCLRQGDDAQDNTILCYDRGRHGFHQQSRHSERATAWIHGELCSDGARSRRNADTAPASLVDRHCGVGRRRQEPTTDLGGIQIHGHCCAYHR